MSKRARFKERGRQKELRRKERMERMKGEIISFLSNAVFQLFSTTRWKDELPIFNGADQEHNGIIWANISTAI